MKKRKDDLIICLLKDVRTRKGLTQIQLAEEVGIKRQAIYDIESGRYLPNTGVALKLAKCLECRIEDLFQEAVPDPYLPATLVIDDPLPAEKNCVSHSSASSLPEESGGSSLPESKNRVSAPNPNQPHTRVTLAKVKDTLVAFPMGSDIPPGHGVQPADALLAPCGKQVKLLHGEHFLDESGVLMGCDPAFSLLASHVLRSPGRSHLQWHFASTYRSLERLAKGQTHLAGVHLHNKGSLESNAELARTMLPGMKGKVMAFAKFEEGLMVAKGNPLGIKTVGDLAIKGARLVNREPGAALRVLLDEWLEKEGIPPMALMGYTDLVKSHSEGAHRVLFGVADAALGLRTVAVSWGLDFVPITSVRSDIVIPDHAMAHPSVKILLDVLQSRSFREELGALPGYETGCSGSVIAELMP